VKIGCRNLSAFSGLATQHIPIPMEAICKPVIQQSHSNILNSGERPTNFNPNQQATRSSFRKTTSHPTHRRFPKPAICTNSLFRHHNLLPPQACTPIAYAFLAYHEHLVTNLFPHKPSSRLHIARLLPHKHSQKGTLHPISLKSACSVCTRCCDGRLRKYRHSVNCTRLGPSDTHVRARDHSRCCSLWRQNVGKSAMRRPV